MLTEEEVERRERVIAKLKEFDNWIRSDDVKLVEDVKVIIKTLRIWTGVMIQKAIINGWKIT